MTCHMAFLVLLLHALGVNALVLVLTHLYVRVADATGLASLGQCSCVSAILCGLMHSKSCTNDVWEVLNHFWCLTYVCTCMVCILIMNPVLQCH